MSQSKPFVAKILLATVDPVPIPFGGGPGNNNFSAYILYDNSGNPPAPCSQYPASSSCVIVGAPGAPPAYGAFFGGGGTPSASIQFYPNQAANAYAFNYTLNAGNEPWMGIQVCKPTTLLTLGAPPVPGVGNGVLSLYSSPGGSDTFLGWMDSAYAKKLGIANVGMTVTVVTPGAADLINSAKSFCAIIAAWENSQANLDFDWVDLSGEDFSKTVLANVVVQGLPTAPSITVKSTWANADLSGTSFAGNTIQNAAFDNAVVNETDFTGATLLNATFNGTTGSGPIFIGAALGASFSYTQIVKPVFDKTTNFNQGPQVTDFSYASLPGTVFSNCDLRGISFTGGDFSNAKFDGALLQGAIFDHAKLANADFTGANLQGTQFTHTDVSETIFSPSANFSTDPTNRTSFAGTVLPAGFNQYNWQYLDLSGAKWPAKPAEITDLNAQGALLKGFDFSNVTFTASDPANNPTNFASAVLANASFASANLQGANFTLANGEAENSGPFSNVASFAGANLRDCTFKTALMSGVNFAFALLWGNANVAGATLTEADFSNAYLASAQFDGLKGQLCAGVNFTAACLVNATFDQTILNAGPTGTQVNFDGAFLQGADFSTATLDSVDLDGAVLATESGSVQPVFTTAPPGGAPLFPLSYEATSLQPSQTNRNTVCVTGDHGPCSAPQLAPPNPMPTTWTQPETI